MSVIQALASKAWRIRISRRRAGSILDSSCRGAPFRQLVLNASNFLRTDVVVLGILLIGLFAALFELGLRWLARALVPWKGKQ